MDTMMISEIAEKKLKLIFQIIMLLESLPPEDEKIILDEMKHVLYRAGAFGPDLSDFVNDVASSVRLIDIRGGSRRGPV